ncbi:MAG: lamin tail domain-containing protein, partial [Anaerolineae bacterium]|nr:lamin tail domain-containing protein [Anaerolineae bacterium]
EAASQVPLLEIGDKGQEAIINEAAFIRSNIAGWRVAPTLSGGPVDTTARTGIVAPALTEAALLDAVRARRVFATEDSNLALTLRSPTAWMGSVLTPTESLTLTIDLSDPDDEPVTVYLFDGNVQWDFMAFDSTPIQWTVPVQARPGHFFWVKAIQADGDTAYSAPLWIEGQFVPDQVYLNEILPAPKDWDWDGDGTADSKDEWIELYNPNDWPVGLGGWQLSDNTAKPFDFPVDVVIPPRGLVVIYRADFGFALNNGGDTVTLSHPNGTIIDQTTYSGTPGENETWCRLPDGGQRWSKDCGPSPFEGNWEKEPPGPLTVNIFDAKRLTRNAWVKIDGRVTAPPGILGVRIMYIQDESSGIQIYLPKDHELYFNLGDKVEVIGKLRSSAGEARISVSHRRDISFKGTDDPLPPLPIATTSMLEPYEGYLVMLQGLVVDYRGRTTLWVDDGTDWAKIFVRRTTGIRRPFTARGVPIIAVGIVSQFSRGTPTRQDFRLLLRYPEDFVIVDLPPPPTQPESNWPTLLPETGY